MNVAKSKTAADLGKTGIRFVVTIVGLLLLRGLAGALLMLKSAGAIGGTLLTPLVLVNVVVDTLILIALVRFGLAVSRALRGSYPNMPDLSTAALMGFVLIVLVLAYNIYELPTACVTFSAQSTSSPDAATAEAIRQAWQQLGQGNFANQLGTGAGDLLAAYQKVAVVRLRQSPDVYGWFFLVLSLIPIAAIVVIASRNLDAISELLFLKATSATAGFERSNVNEPSVASAVPNGTLSAEDMNQLARLKWLLDQGAITPSDFEARKRNLLHRPASADEPAEIQRLKQLRDMGVFTQSEYEMQVRQFLARC